MGFTQVGLGAITGFAAQLGLSARPAKDGSYGFRFTRAGHLSITPSRTGDRVVVSLSRASARLDAARLARLLGTGGYDSGSNRIVHAGLADGGDVYLAFNLDERELSITTLHAALEQLASLHDRAA